MSPGAQAGCATRAKTIRPLLGMFAVALAVPLLAFGARFAMEWGLAWQCPARLLFHVPCPSCGTTRCLAALSSGEIMAAFRFNPLVTLAIPILIVIPFVGGQARLKIGWPLFFTIVALNWIYLILFLPP
jgi:hypothetical protein